jgi:hypothetical protein
VGNLDEREHSSDEREGNLDDVEAHGNLDRASEGQADASSDETDDFEAHGLTGAPVDAPVE